MRIFQTESWLKKILSAVAFVCAAGISCLILWPLHTWVSASHPVLDNPVVGMLIGFVLMLLFSPIETRFLRRVTDREYLMPFPVRNMAFQSILPVSYGVAAGAFLAFLPPIPG